MYQALYRAYRPEVFEEILGQEHIVKILKNQIATDSTSHAYLFCGTRGTGKTTTARLLAKGLNCRGAEEGFISDGDAKPCGKCSACRAIKDGSFIDVIEIDAASNNGVDHIRELRESVNYPPAVGRKKIYIIDEVHMLTTGAFNALLKTLEEPPEYVTFILATTEVQKLPATILSRCMRLDFKRVPESILVSGMTDICRRIDIDVTEDALRIIAANADGSVRDGLSILDQCISGGDRHVEAADVLEFLGASGEEVFIEMTDIVRKKRTAEAIEYLNGVLEDGKDVRQFIRDWISHYRNLLMAKFIKNPQSVISMSAENIDRIRKQSGSLDLDDINRGILELSRTMNDARWSTQPRILLELAIVKLCLGTGEIREALDVPSPDKLEPKPEPAAPAVQEDPMNLDELWNNVFEDGEGEMGSFFVIRAGSTLRAMDEHNFTVFAYNSIAKQHMENNSKIIEDLMEKHTGLRRNMKVVLKEQDPDDMDAPERSIHEVAKDAGGFLGIDVEIK